MKSTKNTYVIIAASLAAALFLPAACKVEVPTVPEEEKTNAVTLSDMNLTFGTKEGSGGGGSYQDTTFRVCLFSTSTYYYTGLYGTYCLPNPEKDSRWLTPCKVVDATGAYDSSATDPEATIHGLQARNGTYFMSIASPAVEMQSPKTGIYGYHYSRERTPGQKVLCVSDSIRAVISGISTNGSWLYVVDKDIRLKERRSKFKLSVSCGGDIDLTAVKSVSLYNLISEGYYLPSSMEFDYGSSGRDSVIVKDWSPAKTLYKKDTVWCELQPYILSMDYSKLDQNKNPVHPLPEIVLAIGGDGGTVVKIPIAYNMLPEKIYKCHITINSCYVSLTMSALAWDDPITVSGSNDSYSQQSFTVTVNLWDNGTQGTDGDTQILDEQ